MSKESDERIKSALESAERKTDNILIRLASSPYTVLILLGAVAGVGIWWLWWS